MLLVLWLAVTPLEEARLQCEKDFNACPLRDQLEEQQRAEDRKRSDEEYERSKREAAALQAEAAAEEQAEQKAQEQADTALKKKCGSDFHKLRVGMSFARVKQCSGLEFELTAQDEKGSVYSASGGWVRVQAGRVTRWAAPR